ncbi:MAG: cryptochrome/photolyase family protein [Thermonemataceae bacterium]|nr:cryptochrome/photolyase family protein [Thermonemataceae bacterium]
MKTLRLILGDQLNSAHSWFKDTNHNVSYVIMEILQETNYVKHHIQKVLCFFAAMRNFASELQNKGHQVIYLCLDNPDNQQDIQKNIIHLVQKHHFQKFEYLLPDEYRLDKQLKDLCSSIHIPTQVFDTEHFLTERTFLHTFFKEKKTYVMETFYRFLRKKYAILMKNTEPVGDKWNFDVENRAKYKGSPHVPTNIFPTQDLSEIFEMLQTIKVETIGKCNPKSVQWITSRKEALVCLAYFCKYLLPYFGTYQDAMQHKEPFLFHSRLSFALNIKLLHPLEVIEKAIESWQENTQKITLAQIEGFIRQILGWREYMRGVYWAKMPEFAQTNYFEHQRKLPEFYWTGKTKMFCLKDAIDNSLNYAYAHHIQRLMLTGNFALLAGVHPDEVDKWYLGIYIDAIEWVEITNTRGMSQFADGGWVASKPYAASANYIHKMSNYCEQCFYDKNKKYGDKACPFNSLYWHFYQRNESLLNKNPRIGMMYQTLKKMDREERERILKQGDFYLKEIENL